MKQTMTEAELVKAVEEANQEYCDLVADYNELLRYRKSLEERNAKLKKENRRLVDENLSLHMLVKDVFRSVKSYAEDYAFISNT